MSKSNHFFQKLLKPFTSNSNTEENGMDLQELTARDQKYYSFETLVAATENFHPSRKLGEGGFGPVFLGNLDDGREVAVKRLSQRSAQGKKEFQNEAKLLANIQHRNVVNLLGYCVHDTERLLVYEYVHNESLDKLLFKSNKRELLDWNKRHDVIIGIAKGLRYLHEEAPHCVIHRDIKASNILLDDKWAPKIADFGMSRLYPEDETHVSTQHIAGTNGYLAPEYLMHGRLSKKADVFSFGVVILELISGQKNSTFNRDPYSQNLLEWAYKLYRKQRSWEVMDPVLPPSSNHDQIKMFVHLGLLCVQSDPDLRPDMDRVVGILSRKPSNLEKPSRPGYISSQHRRRNPSAIASSATGTSDKSSSRSFDSTSTTTTTATASASASASASSSTGQRVGRHGNPPVEY